MTIRPGQPWGTVEPLPDDVVTVVDDASVASLLDPSDGTGPPQPVAPRRGDCWRAAGGRPEWDRVAAGGEVALLPWDAVEVRADGRRWWAVAHVVARGRAWSGEIVAIMNVDHLGDWDVAPRAHPNDGLIDSVHVDAAMGWRARWQARRRLPSGTHLPHPLISVRRAETFTFRFAHPRWLFVDGVGVGRVRHLEARVHPDRLTLCV